MAVPFLDPPNPPKSMAYPLSDEPVFRPSGSNYYETQRQYQAGGWFFWMQPLVVLLFIALAALLFV